MLRNTYVSLGLRQLGWASIAMLGGFAISCFIFPNIPGLLVSTILALFLFAVLEHKRNRTRLGWGLLSWRVIAGVAAMYLSFAVYFWRHNISIRSTGVDQTHPVVMQATSATYLTALLFLAYYSLRLRHVLEKGKDKRRKFLFAIAILIPLFTYVAIMYSPLAPHISAGRLNAIDWLISLGFTAVFALFLESQHRTKHHTRHGIIERHGYTAIQKYLPKR